ncbi:DUF1013 domain-containing protein [Maritalea sp.]|jgi:hypothetical protein|uniref:DUF1013 domain-containing protein n=1 Tax=Maritalea sp. TaxID=2003361 RepID=UPI0039E616FB
MATQLLMPKATAVWLVDNTGLTFDQIASFCTLHPLEVQGIADGDVAGGIKGANPIQNDQLTKEEIEKAEADPNYRMVLSSPKTIVPQIKRRGPRYTPVSKRQEKPNAILWLVRNHPELKDAQLMRLVGTTKPTIESVRERTHWNASNQTPADPVTLGLCTQVELDMEVRKAAKNAPAEEIRPEDSGLLTAEEAMATAVPTPVFDQGFLDTQPSVLGENDPKEPVYDIDSVFSGLANKKSNRDDD